MRKHSIVIFCSSSLNFVLRKLVKQWDMSCYFIAKNSLNGYLINSKGSYLIIGDFWRLTYFVQLNQQWFLLNRIYIKNFFFCSRYFSGAFKFVNYFRQMHLFNIIKKCIYFNFFNYLNYLLAFFIKLNNIMLQKFENSN